MTAAALFEMLKPNYAWASRCRRTTSASRPKRATVPSPQGNGTHQGLSGAAGERDRQAAGVLVVHENRGLNPYIEDVARRLGDRQFHRVRARRADLGRRLSGRRREGRASCSRTVDRTKMSEDFVAAANWLKARPDCTGKLGAVGFCFGGGIVNQLAVRMGRDLARRACRSTAASRTPTTPPRSRRRCIAHYGELDTRITSGWPAFDAALTAAPRAARRLHLQGRQSRLPQRHDAALRRSRRQARLAAHARLVQQVPEVDKPGLTTASDVARLLADNKAVYPISA